MKQEFAYPTALRIINISHVLKYYSTNHNQVTIQTISSDKIRVIPFHPGSSHWFVQQQSTKSGTEYITNLSATTKVDYKKNRGIYAIEPVLVILDFCDQPSIVIGSKYLPAYIRSYIDEMRQTIDLNHSSYQYPPYVTIIE